ATKIEWLLDHVKGLRKRAKDGDVVFGTIDSWLIYRLTNGKTFATDHTNASRTMLYDIGKRVWDRDLLALFGVPRDALPNVRTSSGDFGTAAAEHFGTELPISGVAGDQQAALFGQGCWQPGQAKNTYGTGAFLLLNTGKKRAISKRGLLTTLACGPRGDGVQHQGCARRDAGRRQAPSVESPRGWRGCRERLADAVPGRRAGRHGGAARSRRDDRARRRRTGRAGCRALEDGRRLPRASPLHEVRAESGPSCRAGARR